MVPTLDTNAYPSAATASTQTRAPFSQRSWGVTERGLREFRTHARGRDKSSFGPRQITNSGTFADTPPPAKMSLERMVNVSPVMWLCFLEVGREKHCGGISAPRRSRRSREQRPCGRLLATLEMKHAERPNQPHYTGQFAIRLSFRPKGDISKFMPLSLQTHQPFYGRKSDKREFS